LMPPKIQEISDRRPDPEPPRRSNWPARLPLRAGFSLYGPANRAVLRREMDRTKIEMWDSKTCKIV
jgi:hypothetical protein